MGINNTKDKDSYYMHIKFIGDNLDNFYDIFQKSEELKKIKECWKIDKKNKGIKKELNGYFSYLEDIKNEEDKSLNLRECLVVKINNIFDPEINIILEHMNELSETQYLPLVLLLTEEVSNNKFELKDNEDYQFDQRLIFVRNYTEELDTFEKEIAPVFLRFCSIHNELGDDFDLSGINDYQKFDLIKKGFPFHLNMVCIGRFGQGKSTGINEIVQEYKAKESCKGCSQTKKITFYQVKDQPIKILDVPGFENEKTVKEAIEKFQLYRKALNKLKDKIHIILYFLNMNEKRAFMELEYPIIEEISKHKSAKIIYVITHSRPNIKDNNKIKVYDRINSGIIGITKNKSISHKIQMFKANKNNVVFVNFHKDEMNDIEPFGKKELFTKIHDTFINSEIYKNSKEKLDKSKIEETIKILKEKARQALFPNKIWGALSGIIPFADMAIQHFIIKKNAIKKAAEIFGIGIDIIEKDLENNIKIKNERENSETTETDTEYIFTVDGEQLIDQTPEEIIKDLGVDSTESSSYIAGGINITKGVQFINQQKEAANLAAKVAAKLAAKASDLSKSA